MGLCWTFMIFWHTREHPTGHLIAGKNNCAKKKQVVQIQIVVQNILYHYLVVLNVKIRNSFLGTLPALGTVRRSWKDEFNRVKTSHCSAPSNSPPEYKPVAPLLPTAHPNTSQSLRSCQLLNWPPKYKPVAPLLPTPHTNTSQSLRSCQLHTQIHNFTDFCWI